MDISDMLGGGKGPTPVQLDNDAVDFEPLDLDEPNNAAASTGEEPETDSGAEMTAVQRIQAYRDGTLSAPMVGRLDNEPDKTDDANADDADNAASDDEEFAEHETNDDAADVGNSADDDDEPDTPRSNAAKNFLAGFPGGKARPKVSRKALMIGVPVVALIAAGVLLPGLADKDKPVEPHVTQEAAAHPPTTSSVPPANPDTVIKPADVQGPEYPISVTPPADAFSGEKGKGWVCSGLDGTVLTITLPGPTSVSEIDVMPGLDGKDADGSPLWGKHRLVSNVAFGFDYGDPEYGAFTDKPQMQKTVLKTPRITRTITMTILYTKDISGKGPQAVDPSGGPGILGDLGKTSLDPSASTAPSTSSADNSRPPTFAVGAIQVLGHPAS